MKTVYASAPFQLLSVLLCCVALQQTVQAQQFAPAVNYPTGASPFSNPFAVAVGDFNYDGIPDLVVANSYDTSRSGTVSILLGNGDGTFRASTDYGSGGVEPESVAVGDFNGDGKPDLVVANGGDGVTIGSGGVSVLLGNGDGTFMPAVVYGADAIGRFRVTVGDFNGDGKLDIVATAGSHTGFLGGVSIFLGKGDGTFAPAVVYPTGVTPGFVAVADFNGDGRLDLAVANENDPSVSVLLGRGDGTFQAAVNYRVPGQPTGIASGDFSGDGKSDLVVTTNGATVSVLMGNGDGTFQAPVSYPAGDDSFAVSVGDLNGDGKLDLIVAALLGPPPGRTGPTTFGNTVNLLLGNGDGTFQAPMPYTVGDAPVSVVVADLNSDGLLDVAVANAHSDNVSVLLNTGQPCRAAPVIDHLRARPDALRPSGRLVDVFIDYEATSECGGSPACTLSVGSNEPLTQKDYRIIDAHHLKLRAEVSDRGEREESDRGERKHSDQLVYQIRLSCTDRLRNVAHGQTIVPVLKDHDGDDKDHQKHYYRDPASDKEEDAGSGP